MRHPRLVPFDRADAVIDGVDARRLAELARRHGCVLRLCVPVGTYMVRGSASSRCTVARRRDRAPPPGPGLFGGRTLYQDPCYGVRQLVDIAIRAVSPAINDPTTAVQSLDRLYGILRAIADRPDPSGVHLDARAASVSWCRCRAGGGCSTWPSPRSRSTAGRSANPRKLTAIFDAWRRMSHRNDCGDRVARAWLRNAWRTATAWVSMRR